MLLTADPFVSDPFSIGRIKGGLELYVAELEHWRIADMLLSKRTRRATAQAAEHIDAAVGLEKMISREGKK